MEVQFQMLVLSVVLVCATGCGRVDGAACCAQDVTQTLIDNGFDSTSYPGGCNAGNNLFCDLTRKTTDAKYGICRTIDPSSVCGVGYGLCGSDQYSDCIGYETSCPDGFSCVQLTFSRYNQNARKNYCVKTPNFCGSNTQMCCPGKLAGEMDERVVAHCAGDNSLCLDANDLSSSKCYDYNACGFTGGECCPNLTYRVSSGNADFEGDGQCKEENSWCSDGGVDTGRICKVNVDNCGIRGNNCCYSSSTAALSQPTCSDGSTCSDNTDTTGEAICQ